MSRFRLGRRRPATTVTETLRTAAAAGCNLLRRPRRAGCASVPVCSRATSNGAGGLSRVRARTMFGVNLDWHGDRAGLPALRLLDREPPANEIDLAAVRRYRLERVRGQMAARDIAACLLFDPVNVRYATGARNMQVYHLRNPSRYLLLPVEVGPNTLVQGVEEVREVQLFDVAALQRRGVGELL